MRRLAGFGLVALLAVACGGDKDTATQATSATATTVPATPAAVSSPTAEGAKPLEVQKVLFAPVAGVDGAITVAALVKNPNADLYMPTESFTATAYDAAGTVLGSNENVFAMAAGEERWVVVAQMRAPGQVAKVDFTVRPRKGFKPAASDPAPRVTVVQSNLQMSNIGGQQVGQVKNEGTATVPQVRIDVVYFDAAGGLLGTAIGFVSDLKGGETVSFRASGVPRVPPAETKTYAVPELLR